MFETQLTRLLQSNPESISIPVAIIFISLCSLTVLYVYLILKSAQSFSKIKRHANSTQFGQVFFLFLVLASGGRIGAFTLTAIKVILSTYGTNSGFILQFLTSLRYLPDIFFLLAFALLGWLVITVFLIGLIQLNDYKFVARSQKHIYFVIWVTLAGMFGAAEILAFILFWTNIIAENSYLLMNSIINFSAMFIVFLSEIIVHCLFSGVPWKSPFFQERFSRANKLLLIWAISRIFEGGLGLYESLEGSIWLDIIDAQNITSFADLIGPICFTAELCVAEVWPILISLDNETIALFLVKNEVDDESQINERGRFEDLKDNLLKDDPAIVRNGGSSGSSIDPGSDMSIDGRPMITSLDELKFDDKDLTTSDEKLGILKSASRKKEKLVVRVIKLKKLTPYLNEEVKKDATKLSKLIFPYISRIRGYYISGLEINIISTREARGSLHSLLHTGGSTSSTLSSGGTEKERVNTNLKLTIAKHVAKGMHHLHSQQVPIIHGHLTPHNILLDENFNPKISDYGFDNLKKYANMVAGYQNQTQYTAPEIFSDKGKIKVPEDPAVDIYSFGMILWELATEKIPFDGMSRNELYKRVCQENSRPKIPDSVTEPLSGLIRACWQQDPSKRPHFHDIESTLEEMLGN